MAPWLIEQNVAVPSDETGRPATPREIREAARSIDHLIADFNDDDAFTEIDIHSKDVEHGPWTLVHINKRGGLDEPAEFYFEKGWPEAILALLVPLSNITGPLVLIADTGEAPVVVSARKTVISIMEEWEHTRGYEPPA